MLQNYDVFYDEYHNCFQVRTRSNCVEIEFDDTAKKSVFEFIISQPKEKSLHDVYKLALKSGLENVDIIDVLKGLYDYELISNTDILESGLDFFEIASNPYAESQTKQVEETAILIIGDGELTATLIEIFTQGKFKEINSLSYDVAISTYEDDRLEILLNNYDFCIVDANQWSPYFLSNFNSIMIKLNKPWLYVGGVEEIFLKIGPIFFGEETGCYNCLIQRIKSNNEFADHLQSYEKFLKDTKTSSKIDNLPHLDILYKITANYVLLEVLKFIEGWSVPMVWKTMLTINAFSYDVTKHTLLKVPYCEACKPNLKYNLAAWLEPLSLTSDI